MISYISRKHKIQFSHLPKCGCQSVRKFLIKINGDDEDLDIWSKEFANKYIIGTTETVSDYKHISIVRNPFNRLVSCYYNKIVGVHWPHFHQYFNNSFKRERPSFYEFVNELKRGKLYSNEHWTPQYLLIGNKKTDILQIEKTDVLNKKLHDITGFDFFHYKSKYHMHNKKDVGEFVGNIDGGELNKMFTSGNQPITSNFYNEELKKMVSQLYEVDIKTLGY